MLSVEDRLDILQLLALYGHVIDERQWSRLGEVFLEDVVMDFRQVGSGRYMESLVELRDFWSGPDGDALHPLVHVNTNFLILGQNPDGSVNTMSKGIGVGRKGRVGGVTYEDIVVRTDKGWRIKRRTARPRTVEAIPAPT